MSSSPLPDAPQLLLPQGGYTAPLPDLVEELEIPKSRGAINRMQVFVRAYIATGFDAAQAAVKAGYSEKCATAQGVRLLKMAYVQKLLREYTGEFLQRYDVTVDKVVRELALIGFSSMGDYVELDDNGSPNFDFTKLTEEQWAAIQELNIEEYTMGSGENTQTVRKVKFKLGPKAQALHDLGQYLKLFQSSNQPLGAGGQPLLPPTVNINFKSKKELQDGSASGGIHRERTGLAQDDQPQAAAGPGEGTEVCAG